MSVTDPLAERIARRQAAAAAHARDLERALPGLTEALRERGAARVVLFGSLATGASPHAGTDVDLCVMGLSPAAVELAELELSTAAAPVHVLRWESAPPELRALVERYGRVLHDAGPGRDA